MIKISFDETPGQIAGHFSDEGSGFYFQLHGLGAGGKEKVKAVLLGVLNMYRSPEHLEDLFFVVMEITHNAIRANYTHLLILEEISRELGREIKTEDFNSADILEKYNEVILREDIKTEVKKIIRGEGEADNLHEKVSKASRALTDEESAFIINRFAMMMKVKEKDFSVGLFFHTGDSRINIDIINTAPITDWGLERISSKRLTMRKYFDENRISDFYLENLDQTESAGYGSAMVDARLLRWGLEPQLHFAVNRLGHKTAASISLVF